MAGRFVNYYTGDSEFLNERTCPDCGTSTHAGLPYRRDLPCPRIVQVTGSGFRCAAREIPDRGLKGVMPVMGMRVFYGIREDRTVVRFYLTGSAFIGAEKRARAIAPVLVDTTFSSDSLEVDGVEYPVTRQVDLSPVETTALALRWGRALGVR